MLQPPTAKPLTGTKVEIKRAKSANNWPQTAFNYAAALAPRHHWPLKKSLWISLILLAAAAGVTRVNVWQGTFRV
jgi:hypothetical protein